jgi:hypothetical protein
MNKDLLFQLYAIHSMSGSEKRMRKFLRRMAKTCGAQSIVTDAHGNLFITKGVSDTYPCLAAHMDQVQHNHSKDFTVIEIGGDVLAWSPKCHEQQGLGADDKNGIFICLECLQKYDVLKVAFFVGEETGCVGSRACDLSFFSDCRFIIEPDRRGGSDLITSMYCGDVCSADFVKAIGAEFFGYKEEEGTITDVGELIERGVGISCLNLSCGYYNAHTDHEVTVLSELENCLYFVQHIVETCTDVYPYEYIRYSIHGGSHRSKWWYDDWYDDSYMDEDYDMMRTILEYTPGITFEEVTNEWHANFLTRDIDILRSIYDDVAEDMSYNDFLYDDEDDDEKRNVPPAKKVS